MNDTTETSAQGAEPTTETIRKVARIAYETGYTAEAARGFLALGEEGWRVFDEEHARLAAADPFSASDDDRLSRIAREMGMMPQTIAFYVDRAAMERVGITPSTEADDELYRRIVARWEELGGELP